jgi:hypothetical protein
MMFVVAGLDVYAVLCFLLCVVSLCVLCILFPMSASLDFVAKCFAYLVPVSVKFHFTVLYYIQHVLY